MAAPLRAPGSNTPLSCCHRERLSFVHRGFTNVQQNQIYILPTYSTSRSLQRKHPIWRRLVSSTSSNADVSPDHLSKEQYKATLDETEDDADSHLLSAEKLNVLLMDAERTRLVKKLSEANQYNRFFKRQLQSKDDDLINLRSDLADLELELQRLVVLAEEIAHSEIPPGTRKIDGEYVQSHLLSCLNAFHKKLQKQIEGVDLIKSKDVTLQWVGMAESVQVMGSFDDWSQGEEMSPEYDGLYNRFSVTLKLRPGRYEVKFLVDGQWQLSPDPELPIVGEGLMQNNLLIV